MCFKSLSATCAGPAVGVRLYVSILLSIAFGLAFVRRAAVALCVVLGVEHLFAPAALFPHGSPCVLTS